MEQVPQKRRFPRVRFSLLALLAVTTLCALAIVAAKRMLYVHPTYRIAHYEKAPGTRGKWFDVGPNRVAMRLVTRNDRDGSLIFEDGRGGIVKNLTAQNAPVLRSAAPWLDVVQIELSPTPDRLDVIEARVFDHKTRTLLSTVDPAYGWRMAAPDVLQIYGLGQRIPEKLDVWFRLQSYPANEQRIATLPPTPKASCRLPDGSKFTLNDIRTSLDGGWTSTKGFLASPKPDGDQVVGDFTVSHGHDKLRWQIAAVLKSGERVHTDSRHFFGPLPATQEHREVISFYADLVETAHFEIRPFGGRERFFFEGVTLPKVSNQPFVAPPRAKVQIAGGEIDEQLAEFAPLDIRVATHHGEWAGGSRAGSGRASITKSANVVDVDKSFTFVSNCSGISVRPQLQFTLRNQTAHASTAGLIPNGFQGGASGGNFEAACWTYRTPLDQVESVEVELKP